jgi:hypothetical protein
MKRKDISSGKRTQVWKKLLNSTKMKKEREKLVVKFNNGRGCILCSGCRMILKIGSEFTPEETQYIRGELNHLPPQFCEQCVIKENKLKKVL